MSDFSPDQDELASVYLDGEANADERARVEGDPALLARVEELRAVHDAVSASVTLPSAAERESIIAAAAASNVVDLRVARRRRTLRIASIAAAILLVVGGIGALIRAASTQSETKFETVAGSIGSTAGGATAAQADTPAAGVNGFSAAAGRAALGSFADRSSLVAAAQSQVHGSAVEQRKEASGVPAAPAANDSAAIATAPSCLVPGPADSVNEIYAATAELEGRLVQLDVFTIADGSLTLVVTDAATCATVFSQSV